MERALKIVRDKSAPGVDGIDYKIKELPTKFKKEMLELYNMFWKEERIPESWEVGKVGKNN